MLHNRQKSSTRLKFKPFGSQIEQYLKRAADPHLWLFCFSTVLTHWLVSYFVTNSSVQPEPPNAHRVSGMQISFHFALLNASGTSMPLGLPIFERHCTSHTATSEVSACRPFLPSIKKVGRVNVPLAIDCLKAARVLYPSMCHRTFPPITSP